MHLALIFIPVAAYLLLILTFVRSADVKAISDAFVKAHVVVFAFIAISTEMLSLTNEISFHTILSAWLLFLLVFLIAVFIRWRKRGFQYPKLSKPPFLALILIVAIAFILVTTFITAIVFPPNNWDSMTYHLPRVFHWINNNNVSFYATEITRQNFQMPLAEFAIMHLQILTDTDWYANLVQWMSFLVLICLGPLVAAELGLSKRQQLISAVIIATLPMAILQASSTQNDLVVSSFLMSFSLFMLRLREKFQPGVLLFAASSLGLALLTKGTAFLYAAALGLSLAVPVLMARKHRLPQLLNTTIMLSMVVIIALAFNAGHFWRNYHLYQHPFSTEGTVLFNQEKSVATLGSNILRNGVMHLGTPYDQFNSYQVHVLEVLLGSQLNNPRTTFPGSTFDIPYSLHEDIAGNLIHMVLVLITVVFLLLTWRQSSKKGLSWYAIGIMFGVILYSWILNWQPWASRLHTPLFAMAAPLLAIVITSGSSGKLTGYLVSFLLILYSLPFALGNSSRSLVSLEWKEQSRQQLYFANRIYLLNNYMTAIDLLEDKNQGEVGLYVGLNDWEYPFWVLARQKKTTGKPVSFRPVGVSNISREIDKDIFLPMYVVATRPINTWEYAPMYLNIFNSEYVSVYKKIGGNLPKN